MSTLLLRLAAPMQSWGCGSKFDVRTTEKEPTKSGVLGLLAAALGIEREDKEALLPLQKLKFGVRVDQEGKLLCDFHTARAEKRYVTHRYYLSDAVFICGLESDDDELLRQYAYALAHPIFPLFLGRRSCPPTLPLVLGISDDYLETALRNEPLHGKANGTQRLVLEAEPDDKTAALAKDVPVSFSPYRREFSYRKLKEKIVVRERQEEHDPFAELEEKYVHDKNGT